jgi:hypothetical protein
LSDAMLTDAGAAPAKSYALFGLAFSMTPLDLNRG